MGFYGTMSIANPGKSGVLRDCVNHLFRDKRGFTGLCKSPFQGQVGFYGTEERCSVYSNESFNTSGYVSDQSSPYTPDYSDQSSHYNPAQVDPPEYIHEESVVCRLP